MYPLTVRTSATLLLLPFLLPLIDPATADEPETVEIADIANMDNTAEITVRPLLCIVDQRTPVCEMVFHVSWRSEERGYYCVLSNLEEEPLRCWSEQRAGQLRDERSVAEDFSYMINEGDGEPPLDSVTVEVVRMDSDDRRRRRRTRHVWDLL